MKPLKTEKFRSPLALDKKILIVDDDKKIASLIEFRLKNQGYSTHCVHAGLEALEYVKKETPALVFLDIRLPDLSGVEVLQQLQKNFPDVYVLMISAHADVKVAVDCMKLGAYDFIEKPLAFPELDTKVKHIFEQFRLEEEVSVLKRELGEKYKFKSLIGKSPEMKKVFQCVDTAARSDVSVLIEGESGTGKELVARAIHFNGARQKKSFIAVNCAAIPETLLESELFGYEKGAFTGAVSRKIGKFEQAGDGTIFLDEIGDLPAALQGKLLRVLQEREIERVGGTESIPIQGRFIAATHQDLKTLVNAGKFREDLYYRVNVFPIRIPPLRERKEDIPELLHHFILKKQGRKKGIKIEGDALKKLLHYAWPGNIRELENFVERMILMKGGAGELTDADVETLDIGLNQAASVSEPAAGAVALTPDRTQVVGEAEKALMEGVLGECRGNVSQASKVLKISRDTFYRKMKKYSIPVR